jgi:hypothetical protein
MDKVQKHNSFNASFESFMEVMFQVWVFWGVMSCSRVVSTSDTAYLYIK